MKTTTETFRCYLKILSPVHIGCDEVYEPTSFVVDDAGKSGPEMVVFDPLEFISGLDENERNRFSEICKKGTVVSILELYKFLNGKKAVGKHVALCSGFVSHYKRVLGLQNNEREITQNLNKFEVKRTAFRAYDERPYIPGSSIKGSLRTAFLNTVADSQDQKIVSIKKEVGRMLGEIANKDKDKSLAKYETSLQSRLLDYNFENKNDGPFDPFKLVKVSDFQPVGKVKTKIIYSNNKNTNPEKKEQEMAQLLEVIQPGGVFIGDVTIEMLVSKAAMINLPIQMNELLNSCKIFYQHEFNREIKILEKLQIQNVAKNFQTGEIPLRIGKHSGAEAVTVNGYRAIKIKQKVSNKYIYMDHATCIRVASETKISKFNSNLKPFGWASLSKITPENEKNLSSDEAVFRSEFEMNVLERLDAAENAKQDALKRMEEDEKRKEEARIIKREAEQKAKEAEENKARLEALPPAEKYVVQLSGPSFSEQEAVRIYEALKTLDGEEKKAVASALKHYWVNIKKWGKKDCSNKQIEKVKEVKKILGED